MTDQDFPLHDAISLGFDNLVPILLRAGADPNEPNSKGNVPLHIAARVGDPRVVSQLLAAGANQLRPLHGDLAVHLAAHYGKSDVVRVFVEAARDAGTDIVDMPGYSGFRPIHCATQMKEQGVISVLLKLGADINTRTNIGMTALAVAAQIGDAAGAKLLIEAGAYLGTPDNCGGTALHIASGFCDRRTTSILLSAGADEKRKSDLGHDAAGNVALMLPMVRGSDNARAKVAGYLRLLARAPALRARSWSWATHESRDWVGQASPKSGAAPRLGVHVFRPKKRESKGQRTWTPVSAMGRYARKR